MWLLIGGSALCFVMLGVPSWGVASLILALVVTRGLVLVRFRPEGLWRLTLAGPRWDDRSSFERIRCVSGVATLIRADGTWVDVGGAPIDWILRNWMPNPVAPEHDGYRTVRRGPNRRTELTPTTTTQAAP